VCFAGGVCVGRGGVGIIVRTIASFIATGIVCGVVLVCHRADQPSDVVDAVSWVVVVVVVRAAVTGSAGCSDGVVVVRKVVL